MAFRKIAVLGLGKVGALAATLLHELGFEVTEIERRRIHDSFWGVAPEGFRIRINSSHASDQPV